MTVTCAAESAAVHNRQPVDRLLRTCRNLEPCCGVGLSNAFESVADVAVLDCVLVMLLQYERLGMSSHYKCYEDMFTDY
jgi:hypothetical protein